MARGRGGLTDAGAFAWAQCRLSLFREKWKAFCSHSFCLRFGAVFPHENSANKKRTCHSLMKPREVLAMQAALFTAQQPAGVLSPITPSTAEQSALSKEGIHLINSCGAVKLKFNLNFLIYLCILITASTRPAFYSFFWLFPNRMCLFQLKFSKNFENTVARSRMFCKIFICVT